MTLRAQLVGGPTAVLEYGGLRWLTDPTFSPPGEYGGGLTKTVGPAVKPSGIGAIDIVLLSHDHHSDNLDPAGRDFLPSARRVLTTVAGAERLGGNATGLEPWSTESIESSSGPGVTVTAVPALHGPEGSEDVTGPVIGFVLVAPGEESIYVSGDNASRAVVRTIAERLGPIAIAVLFAGAVQRPQRFDGAYLTLSSDHAADATKILEARAAFPVHYEDWTHFTQGAESLRSAFAGAGLSDRLALPGQGNEIEI